MIATAQNELLDCVGPALEEFAKNAPELACLLKVLLDELADPSVRGFGISEDGIAMLHESSQTLVNLEDHAFNLARVARALANFPAWITALSKAADEASSAASSLADSRFG